MPKKVTKDSEIEAQYRGQMHAIAEVVDEFLNGPNPDKATKKIGFVLLLFEFGEDVGGRLNYLSNGADRKDIVTLFKEMIARFEGQPELKGTA